MTDNTLTLFDFFSDLPDPRVDRNKRHKLLDIVGIAVCATICEAKGWEEMVEFTRCKFDWLKQFFPLENGIPSADTFRRVLERLSPQAFEVRFRRWICELYDSTNGKIVAIDGKRIRKSSSPVHLVSAWANINKGLCLGQVSTDDKSNEIKAIPELLEILELKGALITIDAMGCQTKIAETIVEKKADYLLAVKGNQPELYQSIDECFRELVHDIKIPCESYATYDHEHGRDEVRRYKITHEVDWMPCAESWANLKTIGYVDSETIRDKKNTVQRRYYISSKKLSVRQFAQAVRSHWGIENGLHWALDVAFDEDNTTIHTRTANENLALIRKIILSSMQKIKKKGESYKRLKKRCCWDHDYLLKVLLS